MMFDVEFSGHVVVEAASAEDALRVAQQLMDSSGAYVYVSEAAPYES